MSKKEYRPISSFRAGYSPFRTCQWPFGDPGDANFHFCGKGCQEGMSYCPEHVAQAYRQPEAKNKAAA